MQKVRICQLRIGDLFTMVGRVYRVVSRETQIEFVVKADKTYNRRLAYGLNCQWLVEVDKEMPSFKQITDVPIVGNTRF